MLQSPQNAQEMCRNDFRTSLKKFIFHDFRKFSTFWDPRSQIRVRSGDFRDSGPKNVSGTRFVSRIRPTWGPGTLFSTILGPLAMYWKCFQRFLESLIYVLIFNLDFAENFVSSISIYLYYPGQLENPALVGMCAPTETRLRRDNGKLTPST